MATVADPQPAELPLPGARAGATVKVHPLLCGTALGPAAYFHRVEGRGATLKAMGVRVPRDQWATFPIVAFVLEHPSAGPVLVDTGLHPSVAIDPQQNLGRLGKLIFKELKTEPAQAVTAQLRARGIEPASVRVVVMTHLHLDHASAMSDFPDARFVFDRREWAAATAPRAALHGYVRSQFDHGFDYRTVDFESEGTGSFASFGRSLDLLGDGSVRLVSTPGHTHGHLSVVARAAGAEVLIVGDAAYTRRAIESGDLPARMEDEHLFRRSLREIQLYREQTPDAVVVPGHDMRAWRSLEPSYG